MLKFGLVGQTLGHSFSKPYHNQRFEHLGINAVYDNYELKNASEVRELFLRIPELHGVNVTIPYKSQVMVYLDSIDADASSVQAVNTIARRGVELVGYNTDVYGFEVSLLGFLQGEVKQALVLGTGGAAKAVAFVLEKLGIGIQYVSRSEHSNAMTYADITPDVVGQHRLIINCTPLGMAPDISSFPEIPYHAITAGHFAFDLVYNPRKTLFLERSEQYGARIKNGLEMLRLQADRAWEIWQSYLDNEHEGS